jgi:hypothetical protein
MSKTYFCLVKVFSADYAMLCFQCFVHSKSSVYHREVFKCKTSFSATLTVVLCVKRFQLSIVFSQKCTFAITEDSETAPESLVMAKQCFKLKNQ